MAIVRLTMPIAELRGKLKGKSDLYARMINGRCEVRRKPRKASAKQMTMRKAFAEKYAKARDAPGVGEA